VKTAIYIVEGTVQIVLTPENDHEKSAVKLIKDPDVEMTTFDGSFYECQGGWYRESRGDASLIIRLDKKEIDPRQPGTTETTTNKETK